MAELILIFMAFIVLLIVRLVYVLYNVNQHRNQPHDGARDKPLKTMVIMGSGGHTAEMLKLLSGLRRTVYCPREYVLAKTDMMSLKKVDIFEGDETQNGSQYNVHIIPRSREVKQSWISTFLTTFYACIYSIPLTYMISPDLVLCNGPGTCIPICGAAFLFKVLGIKDAKIVYVESLCRVKALSLSGKILYWFADHFLVQWSYLADIYPRTKYIGRLS